MNNTGITKILFLLAVLFSFYAKAEEQNFLQKCEGVWEGQLEIYQTGKQIQGVDVKVILTVLPIEQVQNTWTWKKEYISETMPMIKDYKMIYNGGNNYTMDEGDGVYITGYLFLNKLYSSFKVGKIWLTSSYELLEDKLIFEVTSGSKVKIKSKGVSNYSFDNLQRIVFTKKL